MQNNLYDKIITLTLCLVVRSLVGIPILSEPTFKHAERLEAARSEVAAGGNSSYSDLKTACSASYEVDAKKGTLGKLVDKLKPNHIYEHFDSLLSQFVYVKTDENGKLDPRPLAAGNVAPCSFLNEFEKKPSIERQDVSDMCLLSEKENETWIALSKSDRRSEKQVTISLAPKFKTGKGGGEAIEWQAITETKLLPVAEARERLGLEPSSPRQLGTIEGLVPPPRSQTIQTQTTVTRKVVFQGKTYLIPEGHHPEVWRGNGADGVVRIVPDGMELSRILQEGKAEFRAVPKGAVAGPRGSFE